MVAFTRRFVTIAAIGLAVVSWSCSGELDPSDPEDAYEIFRDALLEGDGQTVWERSDEDTRQFVDDRFDSLREMDELIERYLPATDHQLARSQTGAELLDELDSPEELFVRVFESNALPDDEAMYVGSAPEQIQMAEDEESAVILTRGQQEFVLVLEEDDLWYVNLVDSGEFLPNAFAWIDENEQNLEQTVQDLIAEERQAREEIIADLLDREE